MKVDLNAVYLCRLSGSSIGFIASNTLNRLFFQK